MNRPLPETSRHALQLMEYKPRKRSEQRALDVLQMCREGHPTKVIAECYGISKARVFQLRDKGMQIEVRTGPHYELSARIRHAIGNYFSELPLNFTPENVAAALREEPERLWRIGNIGKKSIAELNAWLRRHGQKAIEKTPRPPAPRSPEYRRGFRAGCEAAARLVDFEHGSITGNDIRALPVAAGDT